MKYKLTFGIWEITMACNMRCNHCGSSCAETLPGELDTDEALQLCDELVDLGLKQMTLSGGEPFCRKDWHFIAKKLSSQKVIVNAISNGWLINDQLLDTALEVGLANIGISLDGTEPVHDSIRRSGAFAKALNALRNMQRRSFPSAVVTTVMKQNIELLPRIYQILEDNGVELWQLQVGLPMGNLKKEDVILPEQLTTLIDFAQKFSGNGNLKIYCTDSIGYCTRPIAELSRSVFGESASWGGCQAGKLSLGILHNGDILGCTSIRDHKFIEGNVRQMSLREIWTRPNAFSWNRNLSRNDLSGFCRVCHHGEHCKGGCNNLKLTMTGDLTDNPYCAYRLNIEKIYRKIEEIEDINQLINRAYKSQALELYEVAERCLEKALSIEPDNLTALILSGYVCFKLGDFFRCLEINRTAVAINPKNAYTQKGLGVSLAKCGYIEQGIEALRKSISLASSDFMDPYYDLAVILYENERLQEAISILEQGREKSPSFQIFSENLYQTCIKKSQRSDR
jgi:radical SAM protein with 4Fe4S-binding SPASM domain